MKEEQQERIGKEQKEVQMKNSNRRNDLRKKRENK